MPEPLRDYIDALGAMFQIVEDYSRDQGDKPGWSQIMDLSRVPDAAVPWLGQFVGVRATTGLTAEQQKSQISSVSGWNRGSVQAMTAAAQLYLTGAKTVIFRERSDIACPAEPAYGLEVITRTAETPDSGKVLAALLGQKPGAIVLLYQVFDGADFEDIYEGYATMQDVYDSFGTFQDVLAS